MNVNLCYLNEIQLLNATYNHYVHYYMTQQFKKEMKEAGKHRKDQEKGAISISKKRLGVANNFPKQYLKILSETDAHSDDEYISKNTYKINKLDFRSQKANILMRRVDEEIEKAELIEGKRSKRQNRIEVDSPNVSTNSQPPKGLPIDFYDPTWFNNCPVGKKTILADAFKVAFLPNASQSIRGVQHPDERLSDRNFTEKYWEINTEKYDLSHEIAREDEDSESDYNEAESIEESDQSNSNSEMEEEPEISFSFDRDTDMAHAQDPSQFIVGDSSFLSGNQWQS
ncbi:hypothetical protein O181_115335 [Austropuccinia psidii MF-1]|uniref:Uncharacterized protein n=1 Tax=Austropuccinia psidii MF-1 TaxID=1389203 RepID=A0A9Q3KAA0_9BASI|nr:hypothetical protein [Austropuccinia psidii MF-1]